MGTKTITTAEMNFFQARQRVRKKLGTNTTDNAHCPTTSAELCGGPRPGREMDKAPNTTPFTTLRDDMDHPRSDHKESAAKGKGADLNPPKLLRLLPLIALRPQMARWNRDAESIYKLKEPKRTHVIERSQAIEGQSLFDSFKK